MDIDRFVHTTDLIYGAAMVSGLGPELLRELAGSLGCHAGATVITTADRRLFEGMAVGVDPDAHQTFLRRFHRENPLRVDPAREQGAVVDWRSLIPRKALERTEMYQSYYRPHDLGEGLRLTLWQSDAGRQSISLVRSWSRGPFDSAELAWARALMPHLSRAAAVARRLRGAELQTAHAYAALYQVPHAMLLLDRAGRVVFANAAAETLLRAADGLTVTRGVLGASDRTASRRLPALLELAAQRDGTAGTMRLPRPSGPPALALIVMPLRRAALDALLMPEQAAMLLCVCDPGHQRHPPATLLARLFGLTPAEADVAARLLGGLDLRAIAEESGRSINTVRNLLARLMAKTETDRQSELIRLLGGLPYPTGND